MRREEQAGLKTRLYKAKTRLYTAKTRLYTAKTRLYTATGSGTASFTMPSA